MAQPLPESISCTELDNGAVVVAELFRRKFHSDPPESPHHVAAVIRLQPQVFGLLSYAHFMPFGDIMLVGGVCTNGELIRTLPAEQQAALTAAGSLYGHVLGYGFSRYRDQCQAYFGYCGDARAEEVNLASGFARTEHPQLLVNFHRDLHPTMQRALIAKAASIGPF